LLAEAGTVRDAHLPTDRETGNPRGFAFVEFASDAEAAEAIRRFNGREVDGRVLKVNPAEERSPREERPRGEYRPRGEERPRGEDRPRGGDRPRGFGPSAPPEGPVFFAVDGRPSRNKGSRRNLRARKRGL
jgi:RNA recognition motif-containing protein